MTFEEVLAAVRDIRPIANPGLERWIQRRLDLLTKPPGSLGRLEEIALQVALIRGDLAPRMAEKRMVVFCGDHGVTAEGISSYPAEVTRQMAANFVGGGAAISVLCRRYGIECVVVDAGIDGGGIAGVVDGKVDRGTRNFTREPAMTRAQAGTAIALGFAQSAAVDLLGAGEMGIGNSTSAAALLSAFTGLAPEDCVGRGAGIDDAGLARKADAVRRGLALHQPDPKDGIAVLAAVGGFEIGAIAGLILGAAARRVPIVLDGFISCSAALVARAICPPALDYVLFAHRSAERGHAAMLTALGARPLLDLGMRLGEGSGAALAMDLIHSAVQLYRGMAAFGDAGVSQASAERGL